MLRRAALALLLLFAPAAFGQELDTAVSALVRISGIRDGTPVRGSGFVVGLDRDKVTIITASHVIEGVRQLEVSFAVDRTESFPAGVVFGMETGNPRGLAVFQVRGALPAGVISLTFETGAPLQRGEEVFLLGFPEMAAEPVALRMSFAGPEGNFLRLDRPSGEGLSGAPVLRKGKVVGVVTVEDLRLTYAVKAAVAQDAVIGWGVRLGGQSRIQVADTATPTKPTPQVAEKCTPGKERTENGIVFVRICPGTFTMGSAENDLQYASGSQADSDEKPAHQVRLSEFWISKTEITNEQYRDFRSDFKGEARLPANDVSWAEAKEACEHFGGRLPTEAEWEYAARAGSQADWPLGDDKKVLDEYAWYMNNSIGKSHPVGMKKPNPWGLHDMHGNVWEWVGDWFGEYPQMAQTDPFGPQAGKDRLLRGGSFTNEARDLRSASRFRANPTYRNWNIGFRCALGLRRQP